MRYSFGYEIKTPVYGADYKKVLKKEALRADSLGGCLGYLSEEYSAIRKEYPFYKNMQMNWFIQDFEGSSYFGSFKIEEGKSFIELATSPDLSQFKKFGG